MTAQTAAPSTALAACAWQGTPSQPGMRRSRALGRPCSQLTCVPAFSLVTGCGITFSSPWTNQPNILVTKTPVRAGWAASAPGAAIPLATVPTQELLPPLPAAGSRGEGGHRLRLPLGRCLLRCHRTALGGRNAAFWLCLGFGALRACSGLFRRRRVREGSSHLIDCWGRGAREEGSQRGRRGRSSPGTWPGMRTRAVWGQVRCWGSAVTLGPGVPTPLGTVGTPGHGGGTASASSFPHPSSCRQRVPSERAAGGRGMAHLPLQRHTPAPSAPAAEGQADVAKHRPGPHSTLGGHVPHPRGPMHTAPHTLHHGAIWAAFR